MDKFCSANPKKLRVRHGWLGGCRTRGLLLGFEKKTRVQVGLVRNGKSIPSLFIYHV